MDCCGGLIREIKNYKFPDRTLDANKSYDKPIDKTNHAVNPLEWMVMELPDDPRNILQGVYNKFGRDVNSVPENKRWLPHALEDDDPPFRDFEESAFNIAPIHTMF